MRAASRACATAYSRSPQHVLRPYFDSPSSRPGRRYRSDNTTSNQAFELQGYYADLLDAPLRSVQPATRTAPTPPPSDQLPKTDREETLAKARVVFGSRLAGPVARRREIEQASQTIAGVLVPPRPEEPDNCCMSGCVNCVWDLYRDELEEWAAKSAEARSKMMELRAKGQGTGSMVQESGAPGHVATSMDDDGGGSETNWDVGGGTGGEDLFAGVPVGIREFMKTEKRLKERHRKEGAVAG